MHATHIKKDKKQTTVFIVKSHHQSSYKKITKLFEIKSNQQIVVMCMSEGVMD